MFIVFVMCCVVCLTCRKGKAKLKDRRLRVNHFGKIKKGQDHEEAKVAALKKRFLAGRGNQVEAEVNNFLDSHLSQHEQRPGSKQRATRFVAEHARVDEQRAVIEAPTTSAVHLLAVVHKQQREKEATKAKRHHHHKKRKKKRRRVSVLDVKAKRDRARARRRASKMQKSTTGDKRKKRGRGRRRRTHAAMDDAVLGTSLHDFQDTILGRVDEELEPHAVATGATRDANSFKDHADFGENGFHEAKEATRGATSFAMQAAKGPRATAAGGGR